MSKVTKIAVLASGRGSNFEAILSAIRAGKLAAEVVAVISDQPGAAVLDKARAAGISAFCIERKGTRDEHEREVLKALANAEPRFLILAGYMRIITRQLIDAFRSERGYSRIVNIHPSLLPAFPGAHAYAQAFEHGAKVCGVTVHLVDEVLDGGPICAQRAFDISDCRSVAEVERRGLAIEHELYPEALKWILNEQFDLQQRRVCVRTN